MQKVQGTGMMSETDGFKMAIEMSRREEEER